MCFRELLPSQGHASAARQLPSAVLGFVAFAFVQHILQTPEKSPAAQIAPYISGKETLTACADMQRLDENEGGRKVQRAPQPVQLSSTDYCSSLHMPCIMRLSCQPSPPQ
eukprot:jgi/Ulvmu1/12399/UM009_0046.1